VIVSERVRIPLRPMIGCLGLAPARGETSTLGPSMPWAGNYDLTQVCPASTILFPAQVPGGLFSLGDLHAAMGEHEATFVALECAGSATVRLGVRPGLRLETPRIEREERRYVLGLNAHGDYGAARQQAARLLFELLTNEAGLTPRETYILISAQGDLTLGGPAGTIVVGSVAWGDGVMG
jgi:amidase